MLGKQKFGRCSLLAEWDDSKSELPILPKSHHIPINKITYSSLETLSSAAFFGKDELASCKDGMSDIAADLTKIWGNTVTADPLSAALQFIISTYGCNLEDAELDFSSRSGIWLIITYGKAELRIPIIRYTTASAVKELYHSIYSLFAEGVRNPALAFAQHAKEGHYNDMSDSDYRACVDKTKYQASFWVGNVSDVLYVAMGLAGEFMMKGVSILSAFTFEEQFKNSSSEMSDKDENHDDEDSDDEIPDGLVVGIVKAALPAIESCFGCPSDDVLVNTRPRTQHNISVKNDEPVITDKTSESKVDESEDD